MDDAQRTAIAVLDEAMRQVLSGKVARALVVIVDRYESYSVLGARHDNRYETAGRLLEAAIMRLGYTQNEQEG